MFDEPSKVDMMRREEDEVDLMKPEFQEMPSSRAILAMLRRLSERFQDTPGETTDVEWTAFRALAKAGAAEGIMRTTCTYADAEGPCTEYFRVRGDYPSAMPDRPVLRSEPFESALVRARLTTVGVRWAEYLREEQAKSPQRVRGFVLQLLQDAAKQPGSAQRVPAPDTISEDSGAGAPTEAEPEEDYADSDTPEIPSADERQDETPEDADELEVGLPEVDPFDKRVVHWFGRRLYLGRNTQISRLFWLLARHLGRPNDLAEVQRTVFGHAADPEDEDFKRVMRQVRSVVSKLRKQLREHGLDTHVMILHEGAGELPAYTMVRRFG